MRRASDKKDSLFFFTPGKLQCIYMQNILWYITIGTQVIFSLFSPVSVTPSLYLLSRVQFESILNFVKMIFILGEFI